MTISSGASRQGPFDLDRELGDRRPVATLAGAMGDGLVEVRAEHRLVGVDRVRPVPDDRMAAALHEVADRGRLAGAGRTVDDGQGDVPGAVEQAVHPLSQDRPHCGRLEPGPGKATRFHEAQGP